METVVSEAFWRGRRVFVTGHTGFKGSWLTIRLQRLGAEVVGYALDPPSNPSLFQDARLASSMKSIRGDVRDASSLAREMRGSKAEVVFHLAAQSLVRAGYESPADTFATNVMGTVNLLDAVRGVDSVRVTVIVTSDKCYENREWVWPYRENDALGGSDPYSASKGCAEIVTGSYRRSFFHGRALATVRAGNVIGGGDWASDRLVPDAMRAFIAGRPLVLRNPMATRPWQHVLEPLDGYLLLAERLWQRADGLSDAWNFGPEERDNMPVSDLASRLAAAWGGGARWVQDRGAHPHEAQSLRLDSSKARLHLGWRPRRTLAQAVAGIADWYRAHAGGADARSLVEADIADFERERPVI